MNKMREQFEAWAKTEGLIQESFGVRSVNSMYDVAYKAWQAALASQIAMPNSYVACSLRGGQCKCPTACRIDMESMGPRPVIVTVKE